METTKEWRAQLSAGRMQNSLFADKAVLSIASVGLGTTSLARASEIGPLSLWLQTMFALSISAMVLSCRLGVVAHDIDMKASNDEDTGRKPRPNRINVVVESLNWLATLLCLAGIALTPVSRHLHKLEEGDYVSKKEEVNKGLAAPVRPVIERETQTSSPKTTEAPKASTQPINR